MCTFAAVNMNTQGSHTTLGRIFLNIKKRDVYNFC